MVMVIVWMALSVRGHGLTVDDWAIEILIALQRENKNAEI